MLSLVMKTRISTGQLYVHINQVLILEYIMSFVPFLTIWRLFTFKGGVGSVFLFWRDWRGDVLHCEGRWVPNYGLEVVMPCIKFPFLLTSVDNFVTGVAELAVWIL